MKKNRKEKLRDKMYISEFFIGIGITLIAELIGLIVYGIYLDKRGRENGKK